MSDIFKITINGEDRELFMSFGLLNELTTIVQDPSRIGAVSLDPALREQFITALVAKRKKSGKIQEPVSFDDLEVSIEDLETALTWALDHVLSFFVRSFRNIKRVTEKYGEEVSNLTSSLTGSEKSASKKRSSSSQESGPAS